MNRATGKILEFFYFLKLSKKAGSFLFKDIFIIKTCKRHSRFIKTKQSGKNIITSFFSIAQLLHICQSNIWMYNHHKKFI